MSDKDIGEAIRHLIELQHHDFIREDACYKRATLLGIEALKLIKRHRKYPLAVPIDKLLGEIKE